MALTAIRKPLQKIAPKIFNLKQKEQIDVKWFQIRVHTLELILLKIQINIIPKANKGVPVSSLPPFLLFKSPAKISSARATVLHRYSLQLIAAHFDVTLAPYILLLAEFMKTVVITKQKNEEENRKN